MDAFIFFYHSGQCRFEEFNLVSCTEEVDIVLFCVGWTCPLHPKCFSVDGFS